MISTILCFDFGVKNIGVAVGQALAHTASELPTLKARDGIPNWQSLEQLLQEWQPNLILVGDPLNMDGSVSELCLRARKFANRLHGRFGINVEMVDERLSTFAAKEEAHERSHKGNYGKNPVDSIAARLILESYYQRTPSST